MGIAAAPASRRLLAPVRIRTTLLGPDTWRGLAYVLLGAPLGITWLAVLSTGFLVGGATAVLGIGLGLLLGVLALARVLGEQERRLANALLSAGIPAPAPGPPPTGPAQWARRLVADPRTWRSVGWLLFRALAGVLVLVGAVAAAVALVALLVLPFQDGYLQFGPTWRSTAGWASAWALPVGLAGLAGSLALGRVLAAVHLRVAHALLAPDPTAELAALEGEVAGAAERARLARDLHDSVGHAITLAVVQADAAAVALPTDPAYVARALAEIAAAGRRALDELDVALGVLREDATARRPEPTLVDLSDLLDRARAAGLPIEDTAVGTDRWRAPAARPASAAAYRIVQEAVTNVLRHAGAAPTTVSVDGTGDLQIEVRNSSPGRRSTEGGRTDHEPTVGCRSRPDGGLVAGDPGDSGRTPGDGDRVGRGRGLAGLAERSRQLGGSLRATRTPDGGWSVRAVIPAPRARTAPAPPRDPTAVPGSTTPDGLVTPHDSIAGSDPAGPVPELTGPAPHPAGDGIRPSETSARYGGPEAGGPLGPGSR